jgi:hypothetical protein
MSPRPTATRSGSPRQPASKRCLPAYLPPCA